MFLVTGTAQVIALAPILTVVMVVGALLAFSRRQRRVGTVMAMSALALFAGAFVI